MMKQGILVIVLALLVTACTGNVKPQPVNEFVIVHPDATPELNLKKVDWQVWNQAKLAEEGADTKNVDKVFYVLTPAEADKLFKNLIDISDSYAKSRESNTYYYDSIEDYLKRKKIEAEAKAKEEAKKK